MTEDMPETAKTSDLARLFGVSERQARNLLKDAGVRPTARGQWKVAEAVQGVLSQAKETRGDNEISRARARELNAKARRNEIAVATSERDLIPIEDATAALDVLVAQVREEFAGLPARITRDIELRRTIERETGASQHRLAAKLQAMADTARSGDYSEDEHHAE